MKKQNLKNFKLTKHVISYLGTINGGADDADAADDPADTLPVEREVSAGNWRCESVAVWCRYPHA